MKRGRPTQWRSAPTWAQRMRRAIAWGAVVVVASSPLLVGGMWGPGQALWSLAAIVACFSLSTLHAVVGVRWRWEPVTLLLGALAGITLLRATPAGAFLGGAWEAEVFALWPDIPRAGTAAPGRAPLGAVTLLGVASVVQTWAVLGRTRVGRRRAIQAALAAVATVVGIGVIHALATPDSIFGLFAPRELRGVRQPLAAPFVNENQAGAVWALGGVLLATLPQRHGAAVAPRGFATAALLSVTAVFLDAHGALAAAVIAIGLAAASRWVGLLRPPAGIARIALLAVLGAAVATAIGAWIVLPMLDVGAASEKALVWRDTLLLVAKRPFGWGVGTFPDVIGSGMTSPDALRAAWVESAPLQLAFEHGWIPAAALGFAAAHALWLALQPARGRGGIDIFVVGFATYVIVEANVGMGLQALGYAFPVAAVGGALIGRGRRRSRTTGRQGDPVLVAGSGAAVLAVLAVATLPGLRDSSQLGDEHVGAPLRAVELEAGLASDAMDEAIQRAARAVPGDVVLIAYAADQHLANGALDHAEAFVAHGERYAPGRWITWELATALALQGGDEEEFCEAARHLSATTRDPRRLTRALGRFTPDARRWPACVEGERARMQMHEGLRLDGEAVRGMALAMHTLRTRPDDPVALMAAVEGAHAMRQDDLAMAWGARLLMIEPANERAAELTARAARRAGEHARALAMLDEAIVRSPDSAHLALERLAVLGDWPDLGDDSRRRAAFDDEYGRLLARASRSSADAIRRLRIGATTYERLGEWALAEAANRSLLRLRPGDAAAEAAIERIATERVGAPP